MPEVLFTSEGICEIKTAMSPSGEAVASCSYLPESEEVLNLKVRRYSPSTGWSSEHILETSVNELGSQNVAIALSGHITCVWVPKESSNELLSSRYDPETQTWSSPVRINSGNPEGVAFVQVVNDRFGNALCAWLQVDEDEYRIWTNRNISGTWDTAKLLSSDNLIYSCMLSPFSGPYSLSINSSGQAALSYFSWSIVDSTSFVRGFNSFVRVFNGALSGDLSETVKFASAEGFIYAISSISVDEMGNAHLYWYQLAVDEFDLLNFVCVTSRYTPASGWGTPEIINPDNPMTSFIPFPIKLAIDPFGNAAAIWTDLSEESSDGGVILNMFR